MDYNVSSYYWLNTENTACAASFPFFPRAFACFIFKQVIIPLPIGFLLDIDKFIIALVVEFEIKSKCGVSPLITHPKEINASYFLIFFDIVTGISNTPGTLIKFILKDGLFFKYNLAEFIKLEAITL